jgi:hypothetical protein
VTLLSISNDIISTTNRPVVARKGGWIADWCTFVMFAIGIVVICQGGYEEEKYFRPPKANEYTDEAMTNRLWDNISGRIMW